MDISTILSSTDLKQCQLIGYIDNKVVLLRLRVDQGGKTGWHIIAVDQHAAHERILLEQLESQWETVAKTKNDSTGISTVRCAVKFYGLRGKSLRQCYENHPDALNSLKSFGLELELDPKDSTSIRAISIPEIFTRSGNLCTRAEADVFKFFKTFAESYKMGRKKLFNHLREVIHPHLQKRACNSAVRFGDPLKEFEIKELIHRLSDCRLPFQCAHGRPTCVILSTLFDT
ncbi:MutL dimerization domain protein [Opisthorchis viverrini]|uniref:MutL dimerization domain protein n=1 Tax=Opisthorchis viverrini TaxID=6198 RepID=A0A1S8WL05_OPIVI|nr:MutL dimerization domain protein [Opisthorchis viverrini]